MERRVTLTERQAAVLLNLAKEQAIADRALNAALTMAAAMEDVPEARSWRIEGTVLILEVPE